MSKILLNPEAGAPIHEIQISGAKYFTEGDFKTDSIVKIEDDSVADTLLGIYGFLLEITPDEAKSFNNRQQNSLKCDKCDFTTIDKDKFTLHKKQHEAEEALDKELNIPIIGAKKVKQSNVDSQKQIDEQGKNEGLDVGEGLVDESPKIGAKF